MHSDQNWKVINNTAWYVPGKYKIRRGMYQAVLYFADNLNFTYFI